MSSRFKRRRLILDALLLLAVVLAIFSYHEPWQANAEPEFQRQEVLGNNNQNFGQPIGDTPILSGTEEVSNAVILANETIAAVIAAENSALTPPQYWTSLPVMRR